MSKTATRARSSARSGSKGPTTRKVTKRGRRAKTIDTTVNPAVARYEAELPKAAELAKVAAIFLTRGDQHHEGAVQDAIQKASRLYLACAEFSAKFKNALPKDRATQCGDTRAALLAATSSFATGLAEARRKDGTPVQPDEVKVPPLTHTPATLDDFVREVIRARTLDEGVKRLRDYFRSICPEGEDALTFAGECIGRLRDIGFDYHNIHDWDDLGRAYLAWWANEIAKINSDNSKGKAKLPDAPSAT